MFFLFLLITLIFIILILKFNIKIVKKSIVHLELSIYNIKVFHKDFVNDSYKSLVKNKLDLTKIIANWGIKSIRNFVYEIFKVLIKLRKNLNFKKASVNVHISNANYIKGGYYIGAIETIHFMGKNITDKFEIHHRYRSQEEDLKIGFCLIFEFRIIKILISFIKLLIIYNRFMRKGKMKNGTTSNRKLNDDCNVIN